jgi:multiple sugar transport system permease protein
MTTATAQVGEEQRRDSTRTMSIWTIRRVARELVAHALLIPISIVLLFPLVWLVSTSLKCHAEIFKFPPQLIPDPVCWNNYPEALTIYPFDLYFRNSMIYCVGIVTGQVLVSAFVGYGFARLRFPGRDFLFWLVLVRMMLPFAVTMVPSYVMFSKMKWINTFLPLIVPGWLPGLNSASFYIFLCRQFFMGIPLELDDAAKIDGAGHVRMWWQMILPLSKPVIATVAVFSFIIHWNDFQGPLLYLQRQNLRPMALALQSFGDAFGPESTSAEWQWLMAASTAFVVPMIIMFFAGQRYFLRGISTSGLAGR